MKINPMPSTENVEKWKFDLQNFINIFTEFPFFSINVHILYHILHCVLYILHEINVPNMWWKLINCLFKIKRIESNYSWKKALGFYQRATFCLTKGHLDNPERQVEAESPTNWKLFLTLLFQIKKNDFLFFYFFFSKRALFNKAYTLMLYLPEIGPAVYLFYNNQIKNLTGMN